MKHEFVCGIGFSLLLLTAGCKSRLVDECAVRPSAPGPLRDYAGEVDTSFPDVVAESTPLIVIDLEVGNGDVACDSDICGVQYRAWTSAGSLFDDSYSRGRPFCFKLRIGSVISGWYNGLLGMRLGGRRLLVVPPRLGYGHRGSGNLIPPDTTLIFEVCLEQLQKEGRERDYMERRDEQYYHTLVDVLQARAKETASRSWGQELLDAAAKVFDLIDLYDCLELATSTSESAPADGHPNKRTIDIINCLRLLTENANASMQACPSIGVDSSLPRLPLATMKMQYGRDSSSLIVPAGVAGISSLRQTLSPPACNALLKGAGKRSDGSPVGTFDEFVVEHVGGTVFAVGDDSLQARVLDKDGLVLVVFQRVSGAWMADRVWW